MKTPLTYLRKMVDARGFSIVELMVALAIVSLIMIFIFGGFLSSRKIYTAQDVSAQVQQSLRGAMDFMTRDLRMAGLDPQDTTDFGFEEAALNRVRFTSDRNMDGVLNDPDTSDGIDDSDLEHVAYEYDGADTLSMILYNADGSEHMSAQTLIDGITAFNLRFLDADENDLGNPVASADLDRIQVVSMFVSMQKPAGRSEPVERSLRMRVLCRNLSF